MTYRIELSANAKADIRDATRWLREQASPTVVDRWLSGLNRTLKTLRSRPSSHPLAAENDKFPEEIREMLYGKRRIKYRIVFTIRGDTVVVLYIRHGARDEIEP
jgi:plasmid stabilization system protein ParE